MIRMIKLNRVEIALGPVQLSVRYAATTPDNIQIISIIIIVITFIATNIIVIVITIMMEMEKSPIRPLSGEQHGL